MLHEFLLKNQNEILAMTEKKSVALAGVRPSSEQLKKGLPIFYDQLMTVQFPLDRSSSQNLRKLIRQAWQRPPPTPTNRPWPRHPAIQGRSRAWRNRPSAMAPELLRLGYTLSHVVHAYGAMCQSITELATTKNSTITTNEFHDMNRCLDVAIAGAVTGYQTQRNTQENEPRSRAPRIFSSTEPAQRAQQHRRFSPND